MAIRIRGYMMKRPTMLLPAIFFVLVSLGLTGCGGGGGKPAEAPKPAAQEESVGDLLAKAKKIPGMSFDYVMTAKDSQMNGKMWIEGKKMRTEATMQNQKMISIIDGDANVAYTYMPDQNMAVKMTLDKVKTADAPDQYTKDVDPGKFKVLETTTYDGVRCRVVQLDNTAAKTSSKMWIREDYGLPIRVETTNSDNTKTVLEYKNVKVGPQPADTFKLPAGVKVTDMGAMMPQIPPQR